MERVGKWDAVAPLLDDATRRADIAACHNFAWVSVERLAAALTKLKSCEDMLRDCAEILDNYSDVEDDDEGGVVPNWAMSLIVQIQSVVSE